MRHTSKRSAAIPKSAASSQRSKSGPTRPGIPRFMCGGPGAELSTPAARFKVGADDSPHEMAANRTASKALHAAAPTHTGAAETAQHGGKSWSVGASPIGGSMGRPLDAQIRSHMEPRLGADLSQVRVHTDAQAQSLNRDLGANAFTYQNDIFFGEGKTPGTNELTAHELAHVLQQSNGGLSAPAIQRDTTGSFPVSNGGFEVELHKHEDALTGTGASGLDGYIRFVPGVGSPNSNDINMVQIFRLTDVPAAGAAAADISPGSMGVPQSPRGALGTPGVRTQEDTGQNIEGGFATDTDHQIGTTSTPAGTPMSPNYDYQPTPAGGTPVVGTVVQPAQYGGATGGVPGHTRGFKRSDDPADIRSTTLYDTPGSTGTTTDMDFSFESVARAEDTMFNYGAAAWGFGLRAGHVVNERFTVADGATATFDETLERHRDFYVHEPVTFYFDFDGATLNAPEVAKIDSLLPYLRRNPGVTLSLEGFADLVGGGSAYNRDLSMRRVESVESALLAAGVPAGALSSISVGHGASTAATPDAGTGDQLGSAAVGADQSREANRWANRRVVLTFTAPVAAPAPAPAPGNTP